MSRRRSRWSLRRIDIDLPRTLPIEPPRPNAARRLEVNGLVPERAGSASAGLAFQSPRARVAPTPFVVEDASRWTCGFTLGPGGSVALDVIDAKKAARARKPARSRGAAASSTRRPSAPRSELSLAERLLLVLQPPLESLLDPQGILEWPGELYPYQHEGVAALIDNDALLLADDMGLGKTIQAVAALRVLVHWRHVNRALVVAPASLLTQWGRELEHWAPELRVTLVRGTRLDRQRLWRARSHLFVVSYETLREDVGARYRGGPMEETWDVVVLDEAQKIKNAETMAARTCKSLRRRASWALTGTPLENDLDELASIVDFLTPLPLNLSVEELLDCHRELQLRRRKQDVLHDLPDKSVYDVWLPLADRQRETYERAEREGIVYLRELGATITISHVLALIQRLKQICNVCPETGASAKLDDLADRLEEIAAEGQRALVFSQYVHDDYGVGRIVRSLDGLNPLAYHGGLSAWAKDEVIAKFKGSDRHKALVLSLRAGGQGLNLQEASYVVHFDRWWNPAVERQAEDRTHRLGQKNAVTVYRYICENTIEERIHRILREKQHLFDEYVDQVSIDPGKLLGEREIFGLFGLEPPPRGGGSAKEELAA